MQPVPGDEEGPTPPGAPFGGAPRAPGAPDAVDPSAPAEPARRKRRRDRPHPYLDEASTHAEASLDPRAVTLIVVGLAAAVLTAGWQLAAKYSIHVGTTPHPDWETWTLFPLFAGLGLLAFGYLRQSWARFPTIAGWVLFGGYWAMVAQDLFETEGQDYVNAAFAVTGVFFFVYLAYHEWLSAARRVENQTLRFLAVATFVAAGSYFLIDKIQALRLGLINIVSAHTKWMLDLFGQGETRGLVFLVDKEDSKSPTTFFYPERYCENSVWGDEGEGLPPGFGYRTDNVGQWCTENGAPDAYTALSDPSGWFDRLLAYTPDGDIAVVPVSIILACTALQSIMLFVGLFAGTTAPWQSKLKASLVVGGIIYVLNLIRNTGIIWFYGQGHASFWVMHNAIGKGGSLLAMVAIAFGIFRWFPAFYEALVGVLDLPDRDGPLERTLRIGRRRPEASP